MIKKKCDLGVVVQAEIPALRGGRSRDKFETKAVLHTEFGGSQGYPAISCLENKNIDIINFKYQK